MRHSDDKTRITMRAMPYVYGHSIHRIGSTTGRLANAGVDIGLHYPQPQLRYQQDN
jgi:hypothetical protein